MNRLLILAACNQLISVKIKLDARAAALGMRLSQLLRKLRSNLINVKILAHVKISTCST
tara:strand:- start:546 stop:722 length:177 start_codon:yes stop_codon:yes gene_type:complete